MSYVKYAEDDIEINDTRDYVRLYHTNQKDKISDKKVLVCPYCYSVYDSKNDLINHIKEKHHNRNCVLLINGRISDGNEMYVNRVSEVVCHAYIDDISIIVDNHVISVPLGEMDITNEVKLVVNKNKQCSIKLQDKIVTIKLYEADEIRKDKVNEIIQQWQKETEKNKIIKKATNIELNVVEQQYLNGFYNYFLACNSEGTNKRDRYYDSFSLLNSFESISGIGKSVLKVIAFRFNWINRLNLLCTEEDEFLNIRNYYYNQPNCAITHKDAHYLYVEDELRDDMNAIIDYQKGNRENIKDYLNRNDELLIGDINRRDRIYMIRARCYLLDGAERKSKLYYEEIRNEFMHDDIYMREKRS